MAIPVKYEYDLKDVASTFVISENSQMNKWNKLQ